MSNRLLIIHALTGNIQPREFYSNAEDSKALYNALISEKKNINTGKGGTTFRFFLAYLALRAEKACTLDADGAMKKRPIRGLVDALSGAGANCTYLSKEGECPIGIEAVPSLGKAQALSVDTRDSSQILSAILLIAPYFSRDSTIICEGRIPSQPYVQMTIALMRLHGIEVEANFKEGKFFAPAGEYDFQNIEIERDYSALSYFAGLVILAEGKLSLNFRGLPTESLQGDAQVLGLAQLFGLTYHQGVEEETPVLQLKYDRHFANIDKAEIDFSTVPDLAQTFLVIAAILGVELTFYGVETLHKKETDRLAAMGRELKKTGAFIQKIESNPEGKYLLKPAQSPLPKKLRFKTYEDHRMAMSLSLFALRSEIEIEAPEVVAKSFPDYWKCLSEIGLETKRIIVSQD